MLMDDTGKLTPLRLRDYRFRGHEAVYALDGDGDGIDDLATKGTARAWAGRVSCGSWMARHQKTLGGWSGWRPVSPGRTASGLSGNGWSRALGRDQRHGQRGTDAKTRRPGSM